MRHSIGQKIWTISLTLISVNRGEIIHPTSFVKPVPGMYDIKEISFTELTISEHHRVPDEWSDELAYDGYIAVDGQGNTWHNQYPRACYGQVSDGADGEFSPACINDICVETKASNPESTFNDIVAEIHKRGLPLCSYNLCRFMNELDGGLLSEDGEVERYAKHPGLLEKLNAISLYVQREFTASTDQVLESYVKQIGCSPYNTGMKRWRVSRTAPKVDTDMRITALDELSAIDQDLNLLG